jgi:hypothetical protein
VCQLRPETGLMKVANVIASTAAAKAGPMLPRGPMPTFDEIAFGLIDFSDAAASQYAICA